MQLRKPTTSDYQRLIRIYAGNNPDPNQYTIWFEGCTNVVNRKLMESAADLYKRVCDTVYQMRISPDVRRGPFAHVFAGLTPTESDISALERDQMRQILRTMMLNGETSKERVYAAISLGNLLEMFPPEVNHIEISIG